MIDMSLQRPPYFHDISPTPHLRFTTKHVIFPPNPPIIPAKLTVSIYIYMHTFLWENFRFIYALLKLLFKDLTDKESTLFIELESN